VTKSILLDVIALRETEACLTPGGNPFCGEALRAMA
jgi:hypothetical protein